MYLASAEKAVSAYPALCTAAFLTILSTFETSDSAVLTSDSTSLESGRSVERTSNNRSGSVSSKCPFDLCATTPGASNPSTTWFTKFLETPVFLETSIWDVLGCDRMYATTLYV